MSALGVIMFLVCFAGTRERLTPPPRQHTSIRADLASLWQNDQWRLLCVAALVLLTGMVIRSTLAIYYVKYYLLREDLVTAFVTLGMVGNIIGCALAQPLARRVCKVKAYIGLQLIAATICALGYFVDGDQLVLAFALYFIWCLFLQMATPLLWAKMADTVDYGHWKTGIRITAMVYSSVVFFIKLGLAMGGAIAGWLLAYYGYQADVAQTAATREGILLSFTLWPALASLLVAVIMKNYKLDSERVGQLQLEIKSPVNRAV